MSKLSEQFSLSVPLSLATAACHQGIAALEWREGESEAPNQIKAKVGFGLVRNPSSHVITLADDAGGGTSVTIDSRIWQVGPVAKSKIQKQLGELRGAIEAAAGGGTPGPADADPADAEQAALRAVKDAGHHV